MFISSDNSSPSHTGLFKSIITTILLLLYCMIICIFVLAVILTLCAQLSTLLYLLNSNDYCE